MPSENQDERDQIIEYLEFETNPQQIISIDKIESISVGNNTFSAWKVSTRNDWWVVTPMTNLYAASEYPDGQSVIDAHTEIIVSLADDDQGIESLGQLDQYEVLIEKAGDLLFDVTDALLDQEKASSEQIEAVKGHPRRAISLFTEQVIDSDIFPKLERDPGDDWEKLLLIRIIDEIFARPELQKPRAHIRTMIESVWDLATWVESADHPEYQPVDQASWAVDELLRRLNKIIVDYHRSESS